MSDDTQLRLTIYWSDGKAVLRTRIQVANVHSNIEHIEAVREMQRIGGLWTADRKRFIPWHQVVSVEFDS